MHPPASNNPKKVKVKSSVPDGFELAYLKFLSKENRFVSDAEIRQFPETFFYTLHQQEWTKKAFIFQKLKQYLAKGEDKYHLLDLGCGTGWQGGRLARMSNFTIIGLDVNMKLLQQAAGVFHEPNISFVQGNIFKSIFPKEHFDYIILSSVISYFPDLKLLVDQCKTLIKENGEIHILNSPFFQERELEQVKKAQDAHYDLIGCPEMKDFHFFHTKQSLQGSNYSYLYKPSGIQRLFNKNVNPYPWILVKK